MNTSVIIAICKNILGFTQYPLGFFFLFWYLRSFIHHGHFRVAMIAEICI